MDDFPIEPDLLIEPEVDKPKKKPKKKSDEAQPKKSAEQIRREENLELRRFE